MSAAVRRRRVIARAAIAVAVALLAALAAFPPLRQHASAGGWGITASAAVCAAGCLLYLLATRNAR